MNENEMREEKRRMYAQARNTYAHLTTATNKENFFLSLASFSLIFSRFLSVSFFYRIFLSNKKKRKNLLKKNQQTAPEKRNSRI